MLPLSNQFVMSRLIIFMAVLFCVASCEKEKEKSPYIGEATATKDGKQWTAYTYVSTYKQDKNQLELVLAVADEKDINIIREKLILLNLNIEEGSHQLDTMGPSFFKTHFGAFYATSVDDGDVTGDVLYSPPKNEHNYVIVDSYDTVSCELKGRFNMYLVFGWGRPKFDQSLPDTLWFRDGTFNVRIKK